MEKKIVLVTREHENGEGMKEIGKRGESPVQNFGVHHDSGRVPG